MIVGIHQPNFLPWLGYFYKMVRSDRFVLLDTVAFAKGSYTNRVKIKGATGAAWLTVPVLTSGKLGQPIRETMCSPTVDWRAKIVRTLETNYRGCPHYAAYGPDICRIISACGDNLAELNIALIQHLAGLLDIHTPMVRSSELQAQGKAAELLIAICKELGADTYLSGSGGANYQDEQDFAAAGLKLIYTNYQHPTYAQPFGDFVGGLSVVDLLFNCGSDSAAILRSRHQAGDAS